MTSGAGGSYLSFGVRRVGPIESWWALESEQAYSLEAEEPGDAAGAGVR